MSCMRLLIMCGGEGEGWGGDGRRAWHTSYLKASLSAAHRFGIDAPQHPAVITVGISAPSVLYIYILHLHEIKKKHYSVDILSQYKFKPSIQITKIT